MSVGAYALVLCFVVTQEMFPVCRPIYYLNDLVMVRGSNMFSSVLHLYYDYDVTPFLIVDFVGISFLVGGGGG